MPEPTLLTVLCLASEVKGHDFLRECHHLGGRVLLVTREQYRDADWPREAIAETFYLPSLAQRDDLVKGVSWLARREAIDRIVALDDFDVELAALLREHLRVPGMGDTTARYFRDKLAMRTRAREAGILVPDFVPALNDAAITHFTEQVPPPWVLKPRGEAAAAGIRKLHSADELWQRLNELGDERAFHLVERFVPGDVYHVDAIVAERHVVFLVASRYATPPFDVMHGGGLFVTHTLPDDAPETRELAARTRDLLAALGFVRGVTHTEFIRGHEDGRWYFLETAARVGGAYIAEMVEAATGVSLWREWARLEVAGSRAPYEPPARRAGHAGVVLSLARQEWPDTSAYDDPEIVLRVRRRHHAGLVVASPDAARLDALLADYGRRFLHDFHATQPGLERIPR
ncbi:MAG TPA: ATP-grasp domain-containing protein [Gemmatimonadaceae bacterium]|nr:ATP-grasp domain-containing protein [Gemmatimonadaceae bacterium]